MRRTIILLTLLGFLAALLPAALWAEDTDGERVFYSQKQLSRGRPAEDRRPPKPFRPGYARPGRPDYDGKPRPPLAGNWPARPGQGFRPDRHRPGFKPPYKRPPQWSFGINTRYGQLRYDRYDPCLPYCGYGGYGGYREGDYRDGENGRSQYSPAGEPPEEPTYFQGGGNFEKFERMDEEAAAPPPAPGEDNSPMDLETYHLMMKAWQ